MRRLVSILGLFSLGLAVGCVNLGTPDASDPDALDDALDKVIGTGRYASAAFGLAEESGETGLAIAVHSASISLCISSE